MKTLCAMSSLRIHFDGPRYRSQYTPVAWALARKIYHSNDHEAQARAGGESLVNWQRSTASFRCFAPSLPISGPPPCGTVKFLAFYVRISAVDSPNRSVCHGCPLQWHEVRRRRLRRERDRLGRNILRPFRNSEKELLRRCISSRGRSSPRDHRLRRPRCRGETLLRSRTGRLSHSDT